MQATRNNKSAAHPQNIFFIGTKTGKCQLCKETKKLFLLRYGFTLCEDCLIICTNVLEQLQSGVTEQKSKENPNTEKRKVTLCKKPQTHRSNANFGRKDKPYPKMGTHEV
jgi:CRISPR/Cas system-associated protein Csm6